jgi:hypothetical protein
MTVFKSFTFAWWQLGVLKLALLSLGVVVGSTWPEVFVGWRDLPVCGSGLLHNLSVVPATLRVSRELLPA